MNVDQLREDLESDEGRVDKIYLDHLGFPTFGIGHLITKSDAEDGLPVGTVILSQRVEDVFEEDVELVCDDCIHLFPNFFELPEAAQLVIANMMFNMGRTRLRKFKKFIAAVNESNWMEASAQMKDSRWYNQVTKRAQRLRDRIEALDGA
jgi:GH24 family phage-related lysozyme (muramidase)